MKKVSTLELSLVALGISLNVLGTFIAYSLKLPILLDSIGTIFISILLGPTLGVIAGLGGSFISGITFDIYSIYFAPVQVFVAIFTYLMFGKWIFDKMNRVVKVLIISMFSSLTGAIIAAFVFEGITSSGSSYIVVLLSKLGINKVLSVFLVQFFMDYIDRFISVSMAILAVSEMPKNIKRKLVDH
ncbi:MAG: hypothetical protein AB2375_06225 [Tissierellaceae bacterium]